MALGANTKATPMDTAVKTLAATTTILAAICWPSITWTLPFQQQHPLLPQYCPVFVCVSMPVPVLNVLEEPSKQLGTGGLLAIVDREGEEGGREYGHGTHVAANV